MKNNVINSTLIPKRTTINCRGKLLDLRSAVVMGIVNVTPDSFFEGSRFVQKEHIQQRVAEIINDGGQIVDIGAYSSRPGAAHISEDEEWERLSSALAAIREKFTDIIISVDTFRAQIAKRAVEEYDIDIINDISAGSLDKNMLPTIAKLQVPYIMMHMKGTPQTMQAKPVYKELLQEMVRYFSDRIAQLKQLGVNDVLIDPGFGFGKTIEHNYELLSNLDEFKIFEQPLLVGLSRKSMIYKELQTTPEEVLNGTSVLHTIAVQKGAQILRVHDVKEAVECVKLVKKTFGNELWHTAR